MADAVIQVGSSPPDETAALIERELRALARFHFAGERTDHTLQPTALISEAWIRLAAAEERRFANLTAFRAWASEVIRRILVDHARRKRAAKRGGGWQRQPMTVQVADGRWVGLLDLNDALASLARTNSRAARVVEMRFFGGMTEAETAGVLGVSERTARNDWAFARAWLHQRLGDGRSDTDATD